MRQEFVCDVDIDRVYDGGAVDGRGGKRAVLQRQITFQIRSHRTVGHRKIRYHDRAARPRERDGPRIVVKAGREWHRVIDQ